MQLREHNLCFLVRLTSAIHLASTVLVGGLQFQYPQAQSQQDFDVQSTSHSSTQPSWTNNRLWLTPDPAKNQLNWTDGRLMYTKPLPLFNPSTGQVVSFTTFFNFTILTTSGYGYCGDGLAFSISPAQRILESSGAGNLGIADVPFDVSLPDRHLFAVEFDTFANPPVFDPSASHIGIDFNSLVSNATFDSSSSQSNLYLYNNYTISVWVEYIAPLHLTRVFAANSSKQPSEPCVSVTYDLSNLFDQDQSMYAAISASSGASVQGTALFSWSFDVSENIDAPSPAPSSPDVLSPGSGRPSPLRFVLLLTLSLLGVLLLIATCGLLALLRKRSDKRYPATIQMINSTGSVPRHSYGDLRKATQGFCDTQKVGEGGFSSVYKGTLSTGDVVAVKRLKEGLRMEEEFATEIQIISRIRHRNLLQLRGWSYERGEALLVYQYLPNGSLDRYLYGKKKGEKGLLDGGKRFSILVGVAAGLEYLHEGLGECVLHRDVKAANVMLTESFEPMLGDFGVARLITHHQVVTMTAAGTPGYVAPEVLYTGRATDKADVYSFGILALEVACGRHAVDESWPPGDMRLLDWVWQLQQNGKLMDALDPLFSPWHPVHIDLEQQHIRAELGGDCPDVNAREIIAEEPLIISASHTQLDDQELCKVEDEESLQEVIEWQCALHVVLLCCSPWPEDRPTMRQVHQTLRERVVLCLPSIRPTYSRPVIMPSFNSSTSSMSASSSSALPPT